MNQNQLTTKVVKFSGLVISAMWMVGCQTDQSSMTAFFPSERESRATRNFMTAQAAAGA